mmetsp:Transcript_21260/g.23761  ORF Transcript_21260/g.23761 Transcript_21260/m.23761 type:complete len:397 (+) Transcript_21260:40-1230(+)
MASTALNIILIAFIAGSVAQVSIEGSGTTNPSRLFTDAWFPDYKAQSTNFPTSTIDYRAIGSGGGIADLLARDNDWAAADVPLNDDEHVQLGDTKVLHIPFLLGAVNIFHNVPSERLSGTLNLTAAVAAKIFQRNITTWDHPDIMADNPGFTVDANQPILVVRRKDGSSSTNNLSEYLASAAPGVWVLGTGKELPFPANTTEVEGSSAMSDALKANAYTIGYVDVGFGRTNRLVEAALQNQEGEFLTAEEANVEAVAQDLNNLPPSNSDKWDELTLINQPGSGVWPVTTFSYFLIYEDLSFLTREQGQLIVEFIEYALSAKGQNSTEEFGFFPVPEAILTANAAGIQTIVLADAGSPTPPPTTPAPSTGTTPPSGSIQTTVSVFFVLICSALLLLL